MSVVHVRIPEERLAVLIGPGGAVKRSIEERSQTRVEVDREDHSIRISAPAEADPWGVLKARDVVLAIGRGFSPERAFRLFQGENYLDVLDMKEVSGKRTKDALRRLRARLIGSSGRARGRIEELSGCSVSIYGSTVALIGSPGQIERGSRGIRMLLRGSEHSSVFGYLERSRRQALTLPEVPEGEAGALPAPAPRKVRPPPPTQDDDEEPDGEDGEDEILDYDVDGAEEP